MRSQQCFLGPILGGRSGALSPWGHRVGACRASSGVLGLGASSGLAERGGGLSEWWPGPQPQKGAVPW